MNESDAKEFLSNVRDKIDDIDEEIASLISKRTNLAKYVISYKKSLNMGVLDEEREAKMEKRTLELAEFYNIDKDALIQIMNILKDLNKKEQEEILMREKNGKH